MRARTLVSAIAVAATAALSVAQSNAVTNVSVTLPGNGSYALISNPLNNTNNDITNLFRFASDGDQIYRWNPLIQDLDDGHVGIYSAFSHSWNPHFVLEPGEGVFYLNAGPSQRTIQFVGEPVQGPYTNPVPFGTVAVLGNGNFNAYGSIIPVAAGITNALIGLIPQDGDQVYYWNTSIQDFDSTTPTYSDFSHTWNPYRVLQPGIGFFYLGAGANQVQWIRNTTVP